MLIHSPSIYFGAKYFYETSNGRREIDVPEAIEAEKTQNPKNFNQDFRKIQPSPSGEDQYLLIPGDGDHFSDEQIILYNLPILMPETSPHDNFQATPAITQEKSKEKKYFYKDPKTKQLVEITPDDFKNFYKKHPDQNDNNDRGLKGNCYKSERDGLAYQEYILLPGYYENYAQDLPSPLPPPPPAPKKKTSLLSFFSNNPENHPIGTPMGDFKQHLETTRNTLKNILPEAKNNKLLRTSIFNTQKSLNALERKINKRNRSNFRFQQVENDYNKTLEHITKARDVTSGNSMQKDKFWPLLEEVNQHLIKIQDSIYNLEDASSQADSQSSSLLSSFYNLTSKFNKTPNNEFKPLLKTFNEDIEEARKLLKNIPGVNKATPDCIQNISVSLGNLQNQVNKNPTTFQRATQIAPLFSTIVSQLRTAKVITLGTTSHQNEKEAIENAVGTFSTQLGTISKTIQEIEALRQKQVGEVKKKPSSSTLNTSTSPPENPQNVQTESPNIFRPIRKIRTKRQNDNSNTSPNPFSTNQALSSSMPPTTTTEITTSTIPPITFSVTPPDNPDNSNRRDSNRTASSDEHSPDFWNH